MGSHGGQASGLGESHLVEGKGLVIEQGWGTGTVVTRAGGRGGGAESSGGQDRKKWQPG